jgi:hypothetical protein
MSGGGGTPSDTVSDETSFDLAPDAGAATEYSRGDHTHGSPPAPTGGVTEITDLPTAETDTSLRLAPDGVGGVEWSAGGGASMPEVVQVKYAGTAISTLTLDSAPGDGHTLLMYIDAFNTADPTALSSTNTTWTKILNVSAGAFYSLWVGVVSGGAGGTVITITHANSFLSAFCLEVTDTLTGTLGTSGTGSASAQVTTAADAGAGNLVAVMGGSDNTTLNNGAFGSIPLVGLPGGIVYMGVCYSQGHKVAAFSAHTDRAGTMMVAEIT